MINDNQCAVAATRDGMGLARRHKEELTGMDAYDLTGKVEVHQSINDKKRFVKLMDFVWICRAIHAQHFDVCACDRDLLAIAAEFEQVSGCPILTLDAFCRAYCDA